jgi:hypothetical protein
VTKIARTFVLLVLCVFGFALSGCTFVSANYRLTITVDDNGTLYTGTGVWRTELIRSWGGKFIAQAIPVELGSKGTLFVLITSSGGASLDDFAATLYNSNFEDLKIGDTRTITCPDDRCPQMVRFTNERDPATVQAVDPTNLSASFGPGVSLRPINVTIVRSGPTKGLIKRLPWLKRAPGTEDTLVNSDLTRKPGTHPFAEQVARHDFSQGIKQ